MATLSSCMSRRRANPFSGQNRHQTRRRPSSPSGGAELELEPFGGNPGRTLHEDSGSPRTSRKRSERRHPEVDQRPVSTRSVTLSFLEGPVHFGRGWFWPRECGTALPLVK